MDRLLPRLAPLAVLPLLALPLVLAQDQGKPERVPPTVILEDAAGGVKRLPLAGFETADPRGQGGVLLRFEGLAAAPEPLEGVELAEVTLAGGGLAQGLLLGGDEEFLDLRLFGGSKLSLSIEEIDHLTVPGRIPGDWTEPLVGASEGDRLFRASGAGLDRIDGTVHSFSREGVTLETELGTKLFPWEEVAALFIEVFGDAKLGPGRGVPVVVDLADGSRLSGGLTRLSAEGVELVTPSGRGLRLPVETVSELLVREAGIVFLSELEPSRQAETSPFGDELGMRWPVRRDRSTSGKPLRAGGRVWTRGLGVHAPSRLEYQLAGDWKHLRGYVAVDDEVIHLPARGSVRFRIHADEKLMWESPVLHGGDEPLELPRISLQGVELLVLEVDMADEMHVADRADWLRLILAR